MQTLDWSSNCSDGYHWLKLRPLDKRCRRQLARVYESGDHRTYVRLASGRVMSLQDLRNRYSSAKWAGPLPEPSTE